MIEEMLVQFRDKLALVAANVNDGVGELELLGLAIEIDKVLSADADRVSTWPLKTTTKLLARLGPQKLQKLLDFRLKVEQKRKKLQQENDANPDDRSELHAAERVPQQPPQSIAIEKLNTSDWTEFSKDFFDLPEINSVTLQTEERIASIAAFGRPEVSFRAVYPCGFLSFCSVDKEKAIAALREELHRLSITPGVAVMGFLAKPSLIKLVRPARPDEVPDTTVMVDLEFVGRPGKEYWSAFCFVHGYVRTSFNPEQMRALGFFGFRNEGEVGPDLP
jgi:hypothetical protein